ncbi:DUF2946 family protein [Collimonas sp. OK412]|jgi:hypothetical protein|uniref:DUF2946 family protein n=1 Tax=Collimonas sp. (strain OK412) TaxID=1801619 RepID=UPI0008E239BE|nr:DUF2946 family protein [Collimonas sp. OK412]SFD19942.1 Protein of unknown function [Collimonas sp. OK412]
MDQVVAQAMLKWPNVPHCYGWLGLDARGAWRMRDEQAQRQGLPGDKIMHTALVGFINRNYAADEQGCWYFQNGPQRVYVDLALTPYIVHTDPALGFVLQTGAAMTAIESAMLTEQGRLLLVAPGQVAAVDDRDLAQCLAALRMDGNIVSDEALLDWIATPHQALTWQNSGKELPVTHIATEDIAAHFGFTQHPRQT